MTTLTMGTSKSRGGWTHQREQEWLHVVPLNDTYEHLPHQDCWCCPEQDDENPTVWVHHSADEREKFETGERLPS